MFQTSGTVKFPSQVFDALSNIILENTANSGDDLARLPGVRSFLVDTRWRSYETDTNEPAAAKTLHAVLKSDSQRIFGARIATILELATGFGIYLSYPLWTMLGIAFLPLMVVPFTQPMGNRLVWIRSYLTALTTVSMGQSGTISPPLPAFVLRIVHIQRYLLILITALVSLFIQNAVLVGS